MTKEIPAETKKFLQKTAELIREQKIFPESNTEYRLERVINYLNNNYSYGFQEGIFQNNLIRYPHEIKHFMNCYEAGVFSYLLLDELGFNPELRMIESVKEKNYFDETESGDHAVVIVPDGEETYYFDTVNNSIKKVEKEEDNSIVLDDDSETRMIYKSYFKINSVDEIIKNMDFLKTPEGSIKTLTQEYRIGVSLSYFGLVKIPVYFQYDEKNNVFSTKARCFFAEFLNKEILIDENLDSGSSRIIFSIARKNNFSDKKEVCVFDKELLEHFYTLLSLEDFIQNEKYNKKTICRLFNKQGLKEVCEERGVSHDLADFLVNKINKSIIESYKKFDKENIFMNIFRSREYYEFLKKERGKKICENYYDKKELDIMFKEVVEETKELLASYYNSYYDYFLMDLDKDVSKDDKKKLYEKKKKTLSLEKLTDSLFYMKKKDNSCFYDFLDNYLFSEKLIPKNEDFDKEMYAKNCEGFEGFRQTIFDILSLYFQVNHFIDNDYYKKKVLTIIENGGVKK